MEKDLLNRFGQILGTINQSSLFGNNYEDLKKCCVEYLRYNGYVIQQPKIYKKKIKDVKDLVNYFYNMLDIKVGGGYMMAYNLKKDMGIAKKFVEDRMSKCGYSKEIALSECGEIISTVIENYEDFKFKRTIGFFVFGQANMAWVTDKALKIMEEKQRVDSEIRGENLRKAMIDSIEDTAFGFADLDEIFDNMEEGK